MQVRDGAGDPTPAGLAAGGVVVVAVAGGAAAAGSGSNWVGPLIALIGAVFVAILTAVTTNRRQAAQLEDERTRLKMQLAHDRDMGELAHLRETFDQAATLLDTRLRALHDYREARVGGDADAVEAAGQRLDDVGGDMAMFLARLALRLPLDDPVNKAYNEANNELVALTSAIEAMEIGAPDEETPETSFRGAGRAWRRFADAARAELARRAAAE